jgi:CelD/BcsL family acetyltransferase involved in cellulose biosynthesis
MTALDAEELTIKLDKCGAKLGVTKHPRRPALEFITSQPPIDPRIDVSIITTTADLRMLRADWRRLFEVTPHASGSQSWDYALGAWIHVHANTSRLHVVVVRLDGRLVAIWPLAIRRTGMLRVASHLGRGSDEEYAGPLIAPGPRAGEVARLALSGVHGGVDVLKVFNVHPDNPICPHLDRIPGRFRGATPVRVAGTSAHPDLGGWLLSRSRNLRSNLTRSRRRLAALGDVQIQRLNDPAAVPAFVDWLFTHKLAQLDAWGVRRSWLRNPASRRLLEEILTLGLETDCASGFDLTVAGRWVAAVVVLEGARLELAITTYDPAFADASPGAALHAAIAEAAIERGLDLDFRFGEESYKSWWTDRVETRWNYAAALTPLGCAGVAADHGRAAARAVRRRVGPPIKRLLRR